MGALQRVRPIMAYTGSLCPRGVPLSGLRHTKGKSVISFRLYCDLQRLQKDCAVVKMSTKFSGFVIFSYLKGSTFIAVKRNIKL